MDLQLDEGLAQTYSSGLQRARVLTEHWVSQQVYCPNCGSAEITRYANNNPVGDFYCSVCSEQYELKSQRMRFGAKVVDGAYRAMIDRLSGSSNPNLFLLNYNSISLTVTNLLIIPKHFFTANIIEERPPLPPTARRAGWVGCRISLAGIPVADRIDIIRDGEVQPKSDVLDKWQRTLFLRTQRDLQEKGWLLHVMRCTAHPGNQHIRAKIRQKLQVLRDKGFLEFLGRGTYRLTASAV